MSKNAILTGLVIFILAVLLPFWVNLGGTAAAPKPEISARAKAAGRCILDKYDMRADHMQLLGKWRNSVVRHSNRLYKTADGKVFTMSLSTGKNSCLGCHEGKEKFCDKCHNYANVAPYCWECHTTPKEINQ